MDQETFTVSVIHKQKVMLSFVVTVDVQCQGKMEPVNIVAR